MGELVRTESSKGKLPDVNAAVGELGDCLEKTRPVCFSSSRILVVYSSTKYDGNGSDTVSIGSAAVFSSGVEMFFRNSLQASVVMIKPEGTGSLSLI